MGIAGWRKARIYISLVGVEDSIKNLYLLGLALVKVYNIVPESKI